MCCVGVCVCGAARGVGCCVVVLCVFFFFFCFFFFFFRVLLLLSHFRLDCLIELIAEIEVGNRHLLQRQMRFGKSLTESVLYRILHGRPIFNQFVGIILCRNGFERFLDGRIDYNIGILLSEILMNPRNPFRVGSILNDDLSRHVLKITRSGTRFGLMKLGLYVLRNPIF